MLDSNSWLTSRSFSFSPARRAISTGLALVEKWDQMKKAAVRVSRRKSAGDEPDLKVRYPPLAQLGMGVRDEDDRVVLSWHGELYKSRFTATYP